MITTEMVRQWLRAQPQGHLPPPDPDATGIEIIVAAINDCVCKWHGYAAEDTWRPSHRLGAVMLAARLSRRRLTPGGTKQFAELSLGSIQRSDPDASMLLGLGGWAIPRVG